MRSVEHRSPLGYPLLPLEGDADAIGGLVDACTSTADAAEDLRMWAGDVHAGLDGAGRSVEQAKEDAGIAADLADVVETEVRAVGRALRDYASAIATLQPRFATHVDAVSEAIAAQTAAQATLASAHAAATGPDDERIVEASVALAGADEAVDDAWAAYERDYVDWEAAYDRARAMLIDPGASLADLPYLMTIQALQGLTPEEVAEAWAAIPELHDELAARYPEVVGNLEGIPVQDRHDANVQVLQDAIAAQEAEAAAGGPAVDERLTDLLVEVEQRGATLLALRIHEQEQPTAALLYGDLVADPETGAPTTNVNVIVPGADTDTTNAGEYRDSALALNDQVESVAGGSSATIVWLGYDSPGMPTESTSGAHAADGASQLAQTLGGLDHYVSDAATTSVIGFSYGSTTAGLAIGSGDPHGVDRFISVGSAGLEPDALDFEGVEVHATDATLDVLSRGARLVSGRDDPLAVPGAESFESDGGYERNPDGSYPTEDRHGDPLTATPIHNGHGDGGYLDPDSESFYNIAWIIATGESGTEPGGHAP